MAQFTVNAQRFDPYKNFKFRVNWEGHYVAGVSKVSALKRTTEVVKHREGGDPSSSRKSPGRTEYEAITLERSPRAIEQVVRFFGNSKRKPRSRTRAGCLQPTADSTFHCYSLITGGKPRSWPRRDK